jgi:hypothetical protein
MNNNSIMHPEVSHLLDAMNTANRTFFRRSYKEVLEDYDIVKERLNQAREDNDTDAVELFNNMCKNLETKLQSSL